MAITASEELTLTCVACGEAFQTEVWSIVDAAERPDLLALLMDGTLNEAICPHCGATNQSQIALLFHDAERRRVHFAVPADVAEHLWREQAQSLLYTLVEQIPEEARLPYLSDVQVNQEIAGVQRSLFRSQRVRTPGAKPSFGKPIPLPESGTPLELPTRAAAPRPPLPPTEPPVRQVTAQPPTLADAVEHLLAVSSVSELQAVVERFPQLRSDQADTLLRRLADEAFNGGDRDTASAIGDARQALANIRAGREVVDAPVPSEEPGVDATPTLPDATYQAILQTASDAALLDAVRMFPAVLDEWADADLLHRMDAALDEGNERLATLIEERRDALEKLRATLTNGPKLQQAVQVLVAAPDLDAVEQVLNDHPVLLAEAGQQALDSYVAAARAKGNTAGAATAEARRDMLQQVRAGLG